MYGLTSVLLLVWVGRHIPISLILSCYGRVSFPDSHLLHSQTFEFWPRKPLNNIHQVVVTFKEQVLRGSICILVMLSELCPALSTHMVVERGLAEGPASDILRPMA